jgi:hypothetical protein
MSSGSDTQNRAFKALLRSRWSHFAGSPPGDMVATLITIALMFGAMFGCASVIALGTDGLQLVLQSH